MMVFGYAEDTRTVVTAICYRRINHGSFPYMCMPESHITVLEYVITNEDDKEVLQQLRSTHYIFALNTLLDK